MFKLEYDIEAINRNVLAGNYDANGLQKSNSGKHKYPSRYLFVKLLEPIFGNGQEHPGLPDLAEIEGNVKISKPPTVNGIEKIIIEVVWKDK